MKISKIDKYIGQSKVTPIVILILRLVVGCVFIFSGFVKAIDPWGTIYKINDYLQLYSLDSLVSLSNVGAFALASIEFLCGVFLLLGVYRRLSCIVILLMIICFAPVTLVNALNDRIIDCGCFGDAISFTNWESFWKNIAIGISTLFLLRYNRKLKNLYGYAAQWIVWVISQAFILVIIIYGYNYQPLIDFRPYEVGKKLISNNQIDNESFMFQYSKNNEVKDFLIDSLPDDTWTFVGRKKVENKTKISALNATSFTIRDLGKDVTDSILTNNHEILFLVFHDLKTVSSAYSYLINELNDYATNKGVCMIGLSSASLEAIADWRDISMATYPMLNCDDTELKMLVRGNPAIVYVKDGVIVWKRGLKSIDIELLPKDANVADINKENDAEAFLITMVSGYIILLIILLIINRTHILVKISIKNVKKNQNKELNLHKNKDNLTLNDKKMRKNLVAGNWKMNTTVPEGVKLASEVNAALANETPNCDVVIGVPFTHLTAVKAVIDSSKLGLSAENCADHVKGAYTGEVSAAMVASTGAEYVILGHSERRQYYAETAETLKEKVVLALENNLKPIFCIGEVLEQRENGTYFDVIKGQIVDSLFNLTAEEFGKVILAYEPVWAIGTGKTATADQAQEIHAFIRSLIEEKYGKQVAEDTTILYGGSCKPSNAKELFAKPDVDGGLIGGAALDAESFMGIVKAF